MTANGEDTAPVISSSNGKARNETSPNKGEKDRERDRQTRRSYNVPFSQMSV